MSISTIPDHTGPTAPTHRPLTPSEAGQLRDDRARLMGLVFAIEAQRASGATETDWRELLKAARWMALADLVCAAHDGQARREEP